MIPSLLTLRSRTCTAAPIALAIFVLQSTSTGQVATGNIRGAVVDITEAVIPAAKVTLTNLGSESMSKPYIAMLENEDAVWFLEDLIKAAEFSGLFDPARLEPIASRINEIDALYESDEEAYWTQLSGAGRRQLSKLFCAFCASQAAPLAAMRALYAPEIADRILHDRQLCSFIAETIMDIGFDGWPLFTEKVLFIGLNLNNVKEAVASPE